MCNNENEFDIEGEFFKLKCLHKSLSYSLEFCAENAEDPYYLLYLMEIITQKFEEIENELEKIPPIAL